MRAGLDGPGHGLGGGGAQVEEGQSLPLKHGVEVSEACSGVNLDVDTVTANGVSEERSDKPRRLIAENAQYSQSRPPRLCLSLAPSHLESALTSEMAIIPEIPAREISREDPASSASSFVSAIEENE